MNPPKYRIIELSIELWCGRPTPGCGCLNWHSIIPISSPGGEAPPKTDLGAATGVLGSRLVQPGHRLDPPPACFEGSPWQQPPSNTCAASATASSVAPAAPAPCLAASPRRCGPDQPIGGRAHGTVFGFWGLLGGFKQSTGADCLK